MKKKKPIVLIIRDGWGVNPGGMETAQKDGNAVELANTPVHDALHQRYPVAQLSASGADVGLPDGQMGNSEVGHLNLGAGRIVYQGLTRINKAIEDQTLADNPVLQKALEESKKTRLHLLGLVSDGGVHSHVQHLIALCELAKKAGVTEVMVHAITDGRDTSPTGGEQYLHDLSAALTPLDIPIVTVVGRYYAMDRDTRWERNQLAWDAVVNGKGEESTLSPAQAVAQRYQEGETDEFIKPLLFSHHDQRRVRDGDVVFFFNFRADRARQLSEAFLKGKEFKGFDNAPYPNVSYYTMTQYDETYRCGVLFPPETHRNTLGAAVAQAGLTQLRIAETEKYPHVTYFFNGGEETPNEGEDRHIVASPRVATYDLQPEMSSQELTATLLEKLPEYDLVVVNYANPDMVGHTGSVPAAIQSVETIDEAVGQIVKKTLALGGELLVTADHGNCELMIKEDGSPHTAHTTNLVHIIYVSPLEKKATLQDGRLADVAPTLLHLLGAPQPAEMTGRSLIAGPE